MKKILILSAAIFLAGTLMAQTPREDYEAWKNQQKKNYSDYRQQRQNDYNAWRKNANEEYTEWLKGEWSKIKGHEAIPVPEEPKPPIPVVAPEPMPKPPIVIPYEEVVPVIPEKQPVPLVPVPDIEEEQPKVLMLDYYHTPVTIHVDVDQKVMLKNLTGDALSKAWENMSDGRFDPLLKDCIEAKKALALSDWGYISLARHLASRLYGRESNAARLFEEWVLMQSGYKVRLASTDKNVLYLLVAFDEEVFNMSYLESESGRFYVIGCQSQEMFSFLDRGFDGEQTATLSLRLPRLVQSRCASRRIASKRYPAMSLSVVEDKNLISYLNDYPKVAGNWNLYANASLSQSVKDQIYPELRRLLANKNQREKLNLLLNWIQTGLEYEYDEKQFGGERSLFADETLYYPYCDCEDRSILLSVLVKDLVGLDVVLLHFPGHLATAVHFTENVDGDNLIIDGKKYIICDPTYIGAPVGMAMPECKNAKVRVFKLK